MEKPQKFPTVPSDKMLQAMDLHFRQGLKVKHVAEAMGVGEPRVYKLLQEGEERILALAEFFRTPGR